MTQRAPGRKTALSALTAVALLALGVMAPAAFAQVPGGDAVGTVTDTVGTATGGGGTGAGVGTADTVTDTVTGTTSETTDQATGGVGTVVDSTSGTVQNTTDQTKKTIDNTTSETGTTANQAANDAGDLGGNVTNPLLNAKDPRNPARGGGGKVAPAERNFGPGVGDNKAAYGGELAGDRASRRAADGGKSASLIAAEKKRRETLPTAKAYATAPERETFITQLTQAATEAAEKLAFPLGLALMVGAFLMVQGRIDRKDAKLVLAPIDSEQDLLSFQ